MSLGCPRNKLVLGLATYGRSFTLADVETTGYLAPAVGAGQPGAYTREMGFLAYYEVSGFPLMGLFHVARDQHSIGI